jgi:hypothetical protein
MCFNFIANKEYLAFLWGYLQCRFSVVRAFYKKKRKKNEKKYLCITLLKSFILTPDKKHKRTVIEWGNYLGRYSHVCGPDRLLWWYSCYDFRLNQAQCAVWWFRASDTNCLLKKQAAAFHCCHSLPILLCHYHFTPLAVSLLDTHTHTSTRTCVYICVCVCLCIYTLYGGCIRNS